MLVITKMSSAKASATTLMMAAFTVLSIIMVIVIPASGSSFSMKSPVSMQSSFPSPTTSSSRVLLPSASRDFSAFNRIFENASIIIPEEFKVSEEVAFVDLDMTLRNIKCYDLAVGDISVGHEQTSDTEFLVTVSVTKLDLTCEMNYDYSYGILSGDGWMQIQTEDSEALSTIMFTSLDFDQKPPSNSVVENCFSDVEIKWMDFEEDFASEVLEVFQGLIRNTVETAIGGVVCEELSVLGTTVVGNFVEMAAYQLEPYLGHLDEAATDPLYLEHNLILPNSLDPLNLQDTEGEMGKSFNEFLKLFDTHLGTTVAGSSEGSGNELIINSLLQSFFLNDDGSLSLNPFSISTMINPILFEGHDRLTEFSLTLNEVRLYGLDSITRFNSFRNIGKHTLQNELTWEQLRFEFDIILDIKPSKLDDAILIDPSSPGISEHFSLDFTVNNIDVEASLLLVLDEVAMGSMKLGPLFYTDNHFPCLLSIIHEIKLSGLDVDPSYINDGPTVDGFISSGLDRVITDSIEAAFSMYKGSLRAAIPNIFETKVRELINTIFADNVIDQRMGSKCPELQSFEEGFIDFREFFNAKDGSYGDLPPKLKNILDDELLAINSKTGTPRINDAVVAPFTGAQSGTVGNLVFPMNLFGFLVNETLSQKFGIEAIQLRVFEPMIENLDTIGTPSQLLEPNATHGQVLDNYATFGSIERPLRISLKGLFAIQGDPAFAMTNQIDMSLELADSNAWLSLLANIDSESLFNFPLRDVTNLQCWLSTLATPETLDGRNGIGFSVLNTFLTTKSMNMNVGCASCTSSSLNIIPEIFDSLEAFGVSDVLQKQFVKLMMDLLGSSYTQLHINRVLMDAAIRCPHSPTFIGSSASISKNPTVEAFSVDFQSLESIAFISVVVTEVAAVIMAEAHESYDSETTFPLSGQYDLGATNDMRLVDFTSLEASLGERVSFGIESLIGFLNEVIIDPNGLRNESDLRVNSLIRSLLLDENGDLLVTFDGFDLKKLGLGISIKEVKIAGLDTISDLDLFDAIGAQTLQNEIIWDNIRIQLVLSLDDSTGSQIPKERDITISAGFAGAHLSVALLLAINVDLLDSLEMWSIMELENILHCMMSTAETASFTEIELSMGSMIEFSVSGFDSRELSSSANESSRLILESYREKIVSSIPKIFDSTVRTLLNNWLQYQMDYLPFDRCKYSSSDKINGNGFVDLRDLLFAPIVASRLGGTGLSQYGEMFSLGMELVQNVFKIDGSTGLSGFNEAIVEPLTESEGNEQGTIQYPGDLLKAENRIKVGALDTNIQFRAYDVKIENLNTVGAPLDLFSGVVGEAYMLNNTLTAGVGEQPVQLSSTILVSLKGDDNIDISNEIDFNLKFANTSISALTLTKVMKTRLFGFPLRDVFDLNCWLATIPAPALNSRGLRTDDVPMTASLSHLEAHIGELTVTANCTSCTSPRMTEWTDLLSSPYTRNETTDIANDLLDYVTQLMGGDFLQVQIDRALNEAARKCPHSPAYDPDAKPSAYEDFEAPDSKYSIGHLILFTVLTLAIIIIALTIIFTVKCIVQRRYRKWLKQLPPHQIKSLNFHQSSKEDFEDNLNMTTRSMFRSADVPCIIRYTVPIVIVCNILFFLSGHLSLGATVNVEAEVAGEKFVIENFFEFSMARSTIDIWKAGGEELATLILIFSGIWPYSKLLITFWLWFSSPSNISISRRGSILTWLDWLAKWSMIDIFVLVISIAAFRISIESPDTSYLPNDFYAVEMMVIPLWGLYANMIAQLISQITSHVIIHFHRRIVAKATDRLKQNPVRSDILGDSTEIRAQRQCSEAPSNKVGSYHNEIGQEQPGCNLSDVDISVARSVSMPPAESDREEKSISLSAFHFSRPHRGETEKLIVRGYVNKLLLFSVFSIVVCVIVGCILPSFSLDLFGLVGVAVEFGQDFEEATTNHSVFSVLKLLFDQASYLGTTRDYLGLTVLSVLFLSTILLVPIVLSITLVYQWLSISTEEKKRKIAVRLEILQAWQYLEVYLVALFISSWQLGSVSDSMINAYCKNLEDTFARMVYFGVLKEEDAQCFGITSHIGLNAFISVAGAILLTSIGSFVCKANTQYLRDESCSKLRLKGMNDSNIGFPDEASQTDDDDEVSESGIAKTVRQVPVLFTDTFRWMLKTADDAATSNRTLFVDPNNSHWSLPEATVINSEKIHPCGRIMKGTYVHGLSPERKADIGKGSRNRIGQGSIDLASSLSFDSEKSCPRGMKLHYDDKNKRNLSPRQSRLESKRRNSILSLEQKSVNSRMDSIGSSFNDETSINTYSSIDSPTPEALLATRSPGSLRKPPPPPAYRLSGKSQMKPPPPHTSTSDAVPTRKKQRSVFIPSSVSSAGTLFTEDDESYALKSISGIMKEVDNSTDVHFGDGGGSFSQQSVSHHQHII